MLTAFVLFSTSVLAAELTITAKYDFDIAKGTSYTSFKGTTESAKPQTGYYINYDPSDTISPVVVYGNKVYGGSPMTWAFVMPRKRSVWSPRRNSRQNRRIP